MIKLIVQIPCYNEQQDLGKVLSSIPKHIPGVDDIETIVIDDGSSDKTVEIAREHGVEHIVSFSKNQGLAKAFTAGLEACLSRGADIIVNIDADHQYSPEDIPKLIEPILKGKADVVIGARAINEINEFSTLKKLLQKLGSWFVRGVSGTKVPDAPSGFRAIKRDAAMRFNVYSRYSYTLETIIQAGHDNMAVASVPIKTNPTVRPSRLLKNIPHYIKNSASTIVFICMTYRPFTFFALPGFVSALIGLGLGLRFLYFFYAGSGSGHVQSLILASLLMGAGFFLIVVGLMTELIAVNRKLLEKISVHVQRLESKKQ